MDLKFKGRKWVGSIYHKFETMCQEVDDFVNKDTVKYVENQVHSVGENMKKIYSNVLHDFHPPPGDSVITKDQVVTQNQNDATGTFIRSMADIEGKPTHTSEMQLSEELDTVDLRICNSTAVDNPWQFYPSSYTACPEDDESSSHWEEGSDTASLQTTTVIEKDVGAEDYMEVGNLSCPKDVNSSKLPLHRKEQHPLSKNVCPEDANLSLPSNISKDQDKSSIIPADSPRNVDDDLGLRTSQKDETTCNSAELSEEAETGFSLKLDIDTAMCKNSEMSVEENAMIVEHQACENVNCFEDKNSHKFLCTKEQIPVANEDKSMSLSSSINDDHKDAFLLGSFPEISVPNERLSGVSFIETMDDYADMSEEVETNLPLEQGDLGLDVNVRKEHLLTDSRSAPNYKSSSELSLLLREQHQFTEKSTSDKDESLAKQLLISTNEDQKVTAMDKFLPETSVSDDWLRVLEDGGVLNTTCCSEEAKTDLSTDSYHSCTLSDLSLEENSLVQKHTLMKHLGGSEDACDLSVSSRNLHLGLECFNSSKEVSSSKSPLIPGPEDHTTIAANLLAITTIHNERRSHLHEDEAAYTSILDVLSTNNVPSDLVSSNISSVHNEAQSEASSCLTTEVSCSNHIKETEKMCCDYTHSSGSASKASTVSSASLSCFGSHYKTENQMPTFSNTAFSAENLDDLVADVADANLETIDLCDKANSEKSSSTVDNELLCTPTFRRRNFRSYKELIKEAFVSRKKLIKEYKQLPIWYEDIDTLTGLHSEKHLSPHMASASASSQMSNIGETEWELL